MRQAAQMPVDPPDCCITTRIPARLDRLPWARWHWLVVIGLGITWILDGLEVTIVGSLAPILQHPQTLGLTAAQIGLTASFYLAGAVLGAIFFGYLTDRLGRKKLFFITLTVYLVATLLTAFSWNLWSFALFRFMTGAGIGGEYAAINSAIDELIPARVRGRTDLIINSSFWIGTAVGAVASLFFLNERLFSVNVGWRLAFIVGAAMGVVILFLRHLIPESPRWLMTHGRVSEAEEIVAGIERHVMESRGLKSLPPPTGPEITVRPFQRVSLREIASTIFTRYRGRAVLGFVLMASQAFFYNGLVFTYPLVLTTFYGVPEAGVGLFILPFALGNFAGPLLLGPLFDTVGRKKMIALTYSASGLLLAATGYLFSIGALTATTQTLAYMLVFFIASSAASSSYLTVSEIFPVETRAMAIALFYSLGTGIGGAVAPTLFGTLVGIGAPVYLFYGYLFSAALMVFAAAMELWLGVDAERKSLEEIAEPLSSKKPDETTIRLGELEKQRIG